MTTFHTDESRESDALLDGSLSEAESDDSLLASDEALRSARISEYQQASLRQQDALEASLGALPGGLLGFGMHYEQALNRTFQAADGLNQAPEHERAMSIYLNNATSGSQY